MAGQPELSRKMSLVQSVVRFSIWGSQWIGMKIHCMWVCLESASCLSLHTLVVVSLHHTSPSGSPGYWQSWSLAVLVNGIPGQWQSRSVAVMVTGSHSPWQSWLLAVTVSGKVNVAVFCTLLFGFTLDWLVTKSATCWKLDLKIMKLSLQRWWLDDASHCLSLPPCLYLPPLDSLSLCLSVCLSLSCHWLLLHFMLSSSLLFSVSFILCV